MCPFLETRVERGANAARSLQMLQGGGSGWGGGPRLLFSFGGGKESVRRRPRVWKDVGRPLNTETAELAAKHLGTGEILREELEELPKAEGASGVKEPMSHRPFQAPPRTVRCRFLKITPLQTPPPLETSPLGLGMTLAPHG